MKEESERGEKRGRKDTYIASIRTHPTNTFVPASHSSVHTPIPPPNETPGPIAGIQNENSGD